MVKKQPKIDGKKYTLENIHELQSKLDLPSTCEKKSGNVIVFQGAMSPFSNFSRAEFEIDNTKYISNEQYIHAQKALLFDDKISHAAIMKATNPFQIK